MTKKGKILRWVLLTVGIGTVLLLIGRAVFRTDIPAEFTGGEGDSARTWPFAIDATEPCWLRLQRENREVIRVNCFAIDGVLYTHSNRFTPVASHFNRSWIQVVEPRPELEVLIEDKIYPLTAERVSEDAERRKILEARHYRYIPDGIQVYALTSAAIDHEQ